MQLMTLVDILRSEVPGIADRASTRRNLGRLYAERGCHGEALAEFRAARAIHEQQEPEAGQTLEASVEIATSLAAAGRLDEAKREARRILASGDVPPAVSTQLRNILVAR